MYPFAADAFKKLKSANDSSTASRADKSAYAIYVAKLTKRIGVHQTFAANNPHIKPFRDYVTKEYALVDKIQKRRAERRPELVHYIRSITPDLLRLESDSLPKLAKAQAELAVTYGLLDDAIRTEHTFLQRKLFAVPGLSLHTVGDRGTAITFTPIAPQYFPHSGLGDEKSVAVFAYNRNTARGYTDGRKDWDWHAKHVPQYKLLQDAVVADGLALERLYQRFSGAATRFREALDTYEKQLEELESGYNLPKRVWPKSVASKSIPTFGEWKRTEGQRHHVHKELGVKDGRRSDTGGLPSFLTKALG
jgi:hypothetical protein